MLFTPDTNVKIGTYYLKALSDQLKAVGSDARFLQCGQITRHGLASGGNLSRAGRICREHSVQRNARVRGERVAERRSYRRFTASSQATH